MNSSQYRFSFSHCYGTVLQNWNLKQALRLSKSGRIALLWNGASKLEFETNAQGVINGFPLRIEAERVVEKQVDFNPDFLKNMFSKIDWKALADASKIMGYAELPDEVPDPSVLDSEEFSQKFHHALLELHLEEYDDAIV